MIVVILIVIVRMIVVVRMMSKLRRSIIIIKNFKKGILIMNLALQSVHLSTHPQILYNTHISSSSTWIDGSFIPILDCIHHNPSVKSQRF